jgi:hypothetical protein
MCIERQGVRRGKLTANCHQNVISTEIPFHRAPGAAKIELEVEPAVLCRPKQPTYDTGD